ncbi:sugar ABC transporter ATP-binding protein [Feifania hominis]|uniref:Sugar ABC transporter ATP-binding protein n=1 Tax=Feifania hominis TaxID=2763660 RepID=A0A926DE23_9FIRM|nr:sugar ABC transporter ATP-binding protein [Feifania hominis]MBC8536903.1 sugar ABC transporter ATP-binding protein [Feifania hominis]
MYKSFFGVVAMDGMNFSIDEGEVRCLVGENGCGKSTMIKVISGVYPFDEGTLSINGKEYRHITPAGSIAEGIQVIYQDFSLFDNMTIAENIMMYSTVASKKVLIDRRAIRRRALEVLERIHITMDPDEYVSGLNVAQKQMVAICRALAQDCNLLVMDEPTTALTTKEVESLFEIVKQLKAQGVAVVFVSHKLEEVLEICDSITIMRNGKNVYDGKTTDKKLSKEEVIYYMTGKQFSSAVYDFSATSQTPLIEVKNYTLGGAFEDINFSLLPGEIVGITGLLGCGRSELAESLFGLRPADSGTVLINGTDVGIFKRVEDALKHEIAYVPEDRLSEGLHLEQSIADNSVSRVIGSFANRLGLLNRKALSAQVKKGLSSMTVSGMRPGNPVKSLSGGNQQKIVLIKWLASNPKILILNCPTVGVDVGAKSDIHEIVRGLAREQGIGVVVISDDIYEIMQLCNRVLVMRNGRIAYQTDIGDTTLEYLEASLAADEEGLA